MENLTLGQYLIILGFSVLTYHSTRWMWKRVFGKKTAPESILLQDAVKRSEDLIEYNEALDRMVAKQSERIMELKQMHSEKTPPIQVSVSLDETVVQLKHELRKTRSSVHTMNDNLDRKIYRETQTLNANIHTCLTQIMEIRKDLDKLTKE